MMNVEEIEVEIKKEKEVLEKLEIRFEKEEDENKTDKLSFQISRKEEAINKLIDRQQALLDKEAKEGAKDDGKDKNVEEEDLDVCSECGSDLQLVGTDENGVDVYECEKCGELYLDE